MNTNQRWFDDYLPKARATIDAEPTQEDKLAAIVARSRLNYRLTKGRQLPVTNWSPPRPEPALDFDGNDVWQPRPFDYRWVDWRSGRTRTKTVPRWCSCGDIHTTELFDNYHDSIRETPAHQPRDTEVLSTLDTRKEISSHDDA